MGKDPERNDGVDVSAGSLNACQDCLGRRDFYCVPPFNNSRCPSPDYQGSKNTPLILRAVIGSRGSAGEVQLRIGEPGKILVSPVSTGADTMYTPREPFWAFLGLGSITEINGDGATTDEDLIYPWDMLTGVGKQVDIKPVEDPDADGLRFIICPD